MISYTSNAIYVVFAAAVSWVGAYVSMTWLNRGRSRGVAGAAWTAIELPPPRARERRLHSGLKFVATPLMQ